MYKFLYRLSLIVHGFLIYGFGSNKKLFLPKWPFWGLRWPYTDASGFSRPQKVSRPDWNSALVRFGGVGSEICSFNYQWIFFIHKGSGKRVSDCRGCSLQGGREGQNDASATLPPGTTLSPGPLPVQCCSVFYNSSWYNTDFCSTTSY